MKNFIAILLLFVFSNSLLSAAVPSVEEFLAAVAANQEKLNPLHVQVTVTEHWTENYSKSQKQQIKMLEEGLQKLEKGDADPDVRKLRQQFSPEQLKEQIDQTQQTIATLKQTHSPSDTTNHYEFFVDGENYQVRTFLTWAFPEKKDWSFPDVAVTPETLENEFAQINIYSRSVDLTPPARIWTGVRIKNRPEYVSITAKHASEVEYFKVPPLLPAIPKAAHLENLIDQFLKGETADYRVRADEDSKGENLFIVEAKILAGHQTGILNEDGQSEMVNAANVFRAWIDPSHGMLPVKLQMWYGNGNLTLDEFMRNSFPYRVLTVQEFKRFPNGAFYPSICRIEEFGVDPDEKLPQSAKEWREVQTGKRRLKSVVHRVETWTCNLLEQEIPDEPDFFVFKTPNGQSFFDMDAGKVIGGLPPKPEIKTGQTAPPLKISKWLDGETRSLDDLRGELVILDFWGLWCGACRTAVPGLKMIQEKYKDEPIVFIGIHTAEYDKEDLVERIQEYVDAENWNYLQAIDNGTMIENSETANSYGITGFPTTIMIDGEGIVRYQSLEILDDDSELKPLKGKPAAELTAEETKLIEKYQKKLWVEAGEPWPIPQDLPKEEFYNMMGRVHLYHISKRIDASLEELKKSN